MAAEHHLLVRRRLLQDDVDSFPTEHPDVHLEDITAMTLQVSEEHVMHNVQSRMPKRIEVPQLQ